MSSTWRTRYSGEPEENRVDKPFVGKVRLLAVALNYAASESPLNCTIDAERITKVAASSGVKDITKVYDDGTTDNWPCKEDLTKVILDIASRCKKGDYFVFCYSGHGANRENEDEASGFDTVLCLTDRDGNDEDWIDDDVAKLIAEAFPKNVRILVLTDACHSAGVLDLATPGIWGGGRKVAALSGCQDTQCSIDTGDGGAMTNALLKVISKKKIRKLRKKRKVSVQCIFNRMVDEMPEEEEEEEGEEDDEDWDFDEDEWEECGEDEENEEEDEDVDPITGEEPEPGQTINLSWPGGCDPSKIAFPF